MRCQDPTCRKCNPQSDEILIVIARGVAMQATELGEVIKQLGRVVEETDDKAEQLAAALAKLQDLKAEQCEQYDPGDWLFGWVDWAQQVKFIRQAVRAQPAQHPTHRARGPP